jgi:hypothetical protein
MLLLASPFSAVLNFLLSVGVIQVYRQSWNARGRDFAEVATDEVINVAIVC